MRCAEEQLNRIAPLQRVVFPFRLRLRSSAPRIGPVPAARLSRLWLHSRPGSGPGARIQAARRYPFAPACRDYDLLCETRFVSPGYFLVVGVVPGLVPVALQSVPWKSCRPEGRCVLYTKGLLGLGLHPNTGKIPNNGYA